MSVSWTAGVLAGIRQIEQAAAFAGSCRAAPAGTPAVQDGVAR